MKPIKTILAAGILALALGSMAQAVTIVHVTGSTAFRKSTIVGFEKLFILGPGGGTYATGGTISAAKYKCTYVGSYAVGNEQSATYVVMEGTIVGANNPVIVKCAWSGSTGGLITTKNAISITATNPNGWPSPTMLTGPECSAVSDANCYSTAGTNPAAPVTITPTYFTGGTDSDGDTQLVPDITMADSLQASAGITGLVNLGVAGHSGRVGVIPFNWVVSNGVTSPIKFTGCTSGGGAVINYTGAIYTPTGAAATAPQIAAVVGGPCGGANIARNNKLVGAPTGLPPGSFTLTSAPTGTVGATYVAAVNGTCPITNISQNQALGLVQNGGKLLSEWTGLLADNSTAVYASGRNFDSGTRLSELAEIGIGVFGGVQQVCPTFVGGQAYPIAFPNGGTFGTGSAPANANGDPSQYISKLDYWAAESFYPAPYTKSYTQGNSGYNGGGSLAGMLATPGSLSAPPTSPASAPLYDLDNLGVTTGGWVLGYLGRSDAAAACKATAGANTAHRVTYGGYADWKGVTSGTVGDTSDANMNADGTVTNYDAGIQEGLYQLWEVELCYGATAIGADQKTVGNKLADQIYATDAASAGILYGTMHVSKPKEGGIISHN